MRKANDFLRLLVWMLVERVLFEINGALRPWWAPDFPGSVGFGWPIEPSSDKRPWGSHAFGSVTYALVGLFSDLFGADVIVTKRQWRDNDKSNTVWDGCFLVQYGSFRESNTWWWQFYSSEDGLQWEEKSNWNDDWPAIDTQKLDILLLFSGFCFAKLDHWLGGWT